MQSSIAYHKLSLPVLVPGSGSVGGLWINSGNSCFQIIPGSKAGHINGRLSGVALTLMRPALSARLYNRLRGDYTGVCLERNKGASMKTKETVIVAKRSLTLLNLDTPEGRNIALEGIDDFCLNCPVLSEKRCERCKVRSIADHLNATV